MRTSHARSIGVLLALFALAAPPASAADRGAAHPFDFNGDGYVDLAVGNPLDSVGGWGAAGTVNVLYGSATGLTAAGDDLWSQSSSGIKGTPSSSDCFGGALASADFDRDGYADLAVGAPGDRVDPTGDRIGRVHILYGTASGLTATGDQLWDQPVVDGAPAVTSGFGRSLAAGDFDGDGYADVAIGVESYTPGGTGGPAALVIYGGPDGLTAGGHEWLTNQVAGLETLAADDFAETLAAGDFDADGHADLAAGAPGRTVDGIISAGSVVVLQGSDTGLVPADATDWSQNTPGILGVAAYQPFEETQQVERFGRAVTTGDFDGDGADDLAIGSPAEDFGAGEGFNGGINVIYGSPTGLTAAGNQEWHLGVPGVAGAMKDFDALGRTLAAGDLNADGRDDLVAGAPGRRVYDDNEGGVLILTGSQDGLTATGSRFWTQTTAGVPGASELGDRFGASLAIGNFGKSRSEDLAIGTPGEDIGKIVDAGTVTALFGTSTGVTVSGARTWSHATTGIKGTPGAYDAFGSVLTARDHVGR